MSGATPVAAPADGEALASARQERSALLGRYLLLCYLAVLVNTAGYLTRAGWHGALSDAWLLAIYLTYGVFYLVPVFVPLVIVSRLLARPALARRVRRPGLVLLVLAVLGTTAVQLLLRTDAVVHAMYGFHLNGFVWNLIVTDGGLESLGASDSTHVSFALIGGGFLAVQVLLAVVAVRSRSVAEVCRRLFPRPTRRLLVALLLVVTVLERLTFAVAEETGYRPVVSEAGAFPFYMALHWGGLGHALGLPDARETWNAGDLDEAAVNYPLAPIERQADPPRPNIVWLVAESLRADVLDPEIMPATWEFASRATRFTHHYSGGDGTRMGMFSMFYGLPGAYWFPFLNAGRDPVLMDLVIDDGYELDMFTSARFSYPEFDRTIFSRVPAERLHERSKGLAGWENDREHVGELLRFLDERDPDVPFMTFMFFESPHARYYFPEESVIRTPYLEDFDYATMDEQRDMPLIRNRYLNACHHLDSQFARVFEGLEQRGLLDDTIVIVTGDHGEEFMEKGRWGHNSAFTEEQTRVPLLVHVPGQPPAVVDRMTSHLDLPATVLPLLGVTNPPADFSLGHDLFGPEVRHDCLVADWDDVGIVGQEDKIVVPVREGRFVPPAISTRDDAPLDDAAAEAVLAEHHDRLLQLMDELARFRG